jgi:ABC-type multidrug transport system fused ATPase/permease subunit
VSTTRDAIRSSELLSEVLVNYREAFVRNRREFYASEIGIIRRRVSEDMAELAFIPNISKYAIEAFVVLGALLISGIQFYLQDASRAVATLAIFLAAGTRIAPAVLRIQQGAVAIKGSLGTALPTLDLIDQVPRNTDLKAESEISDFKHEDFNPEIELVNICLRYPESETHALSSVNLKIYSGQTVAIVGKSGAGKTSLVDVILGVISPTSGDVLISGMQPSKAIYKWPGAISYVPQDVSLIQGTLYENITLGFPADESNLPRVEHAVTLSKLSELVCQLPLGLETQVGERGTKLSGGQRQRIGIARALFTNPRLIVLDEATSALDGETESQVSESLASLRGKVTIVLIAHRLSSIRHADQVVYISDGVMKAQGTFQEVRDQVPDFDHQAGLMGL